ncbi:hypothetical protein DPMN_060856 [Dreissena polymorpha]|uniref:Uncharacterized protein n=1 Tax=Dreissena polymorpha TaxID=45954 RepID=A0A9D4C5Z5_DREPO|nr:hypothetical protein DPMN_060856 [Dreissena polymorpha]
MKPTCCLKGSCFFRDRSSKLAVNLATFGSAIEHLWGLVGGQRPGGFVGLGGGGGANPPSGVNLVMLAWCRGYIF